MTVKSKKKRPAIPELWGASEVADHLGVKRNNLNKQAGLPEPVIVLIRGQLWLADDIREFARERQRSSAPPVPVPSEGKRTHG